MMRQKVTSWGGCPVHLLVPESSTSDMPADLRANVDHAYRLTLKIERLQEAQRQAMEAAAEAARRWRPVDQAQAQSLCADMTAAGMRHRGLVRDALGMNNNGRRTYHFIVYALLHGTEVVYIGRSRSNAAERVAFHRHDGKIFDSVDLYQCRSDRHMRDLEAVLIDQHAPKYNGRREPRVAGEAS